VAPGADPRLVTLAFEGARDVHIDARGELVLGVEGGEVRQHKPVVYQEVAGVRQEVAGRYVIKGKRQVGFRVAAYDPSRPLVIDPVLVYSTYLGGSGASVGEGGEGIAVDGAGSAYVTGTAVSADFPTTAGAAQTTHAGGFADAYVTKLNASGSGLVFSTYLGGSGQDTGNGIAVDVAGIAYVTGVTNSTDFPTTAGAAQTTNAGNGDAFVTKLDATGSGLAYSTYLGGSDGDGGNGIAVDAAGSAYVTGETGQTTDFPTTAGALQTAPAGSSDGFVTKLDATGSGLVYSTYLGGGAADFVFDIAVDAAGSAYVTGGTTGDFPTTAGALQTNYAGGAFDAFVTKLNATGSGLVFSTYLGGGTEVGSDIGFGIAVDGAGRAYVMGRTESPDFPTTAGALQMAPAGRSDAFVTKLDATGSGLVFSTCLGGSEVEFSGDIALDDGGSAYVTGQTQSTDFPTTPGAAQTTHAGDFDAFVTKLHPTGSRLVYSTYLGGSNGSDGGLGIAVDGAGGAYVTGVTFSTDFPTTAGAFQTTHAAGEFNSDAFVAKIATLPTSIDECKNGGWKTFGVFRNQGDCVSFVASGGKNPPSGP
jgi:hypothetical protein